MVVGFLGAVASGAWLGLVAASLVGLIDSFTLWEDLLALVVVSIAVLGLVSVARRIAGRPVVLSMMLSTAFASLNVIPVLYLFGKWICEIPIGSESVGFANCRIEPPFGGLAVAYAILLMSPAFLVGTLGMLGTLLRNQSLHLLASTLAFIFVLVGLFASTVEALLLPERGQGSRFLPASRRGPV